MGLNINLEQEAQRDVDLKIKHLLSTYTQPSLLEVVGSSEELKNIYNNEFIKTVSDEIDKLPGQPIYSYVRHFRCGEEMENIAKSFDKRLAEYTFQTKLLSDIGNTEMLNVNQCKTYILQYCNQYYNTNQVWKPIFEYWKAFYIAVDKVFIDNNGENSNSQSNIAAGAASMNSKVRKLLD